MGGDGVPQRKDMGPVDILWDGDGVPPEKDMGPVEVLWDGNGVPSQERTRDKWKYYGMELGYLPKRGHGTNGSIMGCRWGTPPRKDMEPVEALWDGNGAPPM